MTERKTYEFLKHLVTRRLIGCLQDIKTAFSDPEWLELYRSEEHTSELQSPS